MEADHYVQSAEVYDILSAQHWQSREESVRSILKSLKTPSGIIADIGSGTGNGIRLIAETLPEAKIYAIEPSASMRVGLMTKILLDPDLCRRVTVSATSAEELKFPATISAALVCGCIGYLDKEDRFALWNKLAECLSLDGIILADVMQIDRPQTVPPIKAATTDVGDDRYEIWVSGAPGESDLMLWDMRCDVLRKDEIIRSFHVSREWHTFGIEHLIDEAAQCGFCAELVTGSPVPAAILRIRR
jgi:SAM-dependent methyltransferase